MDDVTRIHAEFGAMMLDFMDANEDWMLDMARVRRCYE